MCERDSLVPRPRGRPGYEASEREHINASDRYAVAEGTIIRHLPQKLSWVFAVFATGRYTVASASVEREHVEWRAV